MVERITEAQVEAYKHAFGDYIDKVTHGLVLPPTPDVGWHATKYALEAVAALSTEPGEAEGWRDMDSEPLDGTEVIYWHPSCGQWIGNHPPNCARGIWHQYPDGEWHGYAEAGNVAQMWRHLPAAPTSEGSHHGS